MSAKIKPTLVIKTGDTFPTVVARFEDDNGHVNLSTAEKIKIFLSLEVEDGEPEHVVEGECEQKEVEEEIDGVKVKVWVTIFTFTSEDSARAGVYRVEHKITWSPGVIESVPNEGYVTMEIQESL